MQNRLTLRPTTRAALIAAALVGLTPLPGCNDNNEPATTPESQQADANTPGPAATGLPAQAPDPTPPTPSPAPPPAPGAQPPVPPTVTQDPPPAAPDDPPGPVLPDIDLSQYELPSPDARRLIAAAIEQTQGGTQLLDGLIQRTAGLSDEKLHGYGQIMFDMQRDTGQLLEEGPYVERAQRLAQPLLTSNQRDFDYTVSVVQSDTLNAFATAGGFVYFHTELMDQLTDEQLRFVIGHEIGHVELGHTDGIWTYADRVGLLTGDNISMAVSSLLSQHIKVGYSEDQELAADAWGYEHTQAHGVTADDAIATFTLLAHAADESLEPEDETDSVLEELERQRDHHYRTHPPARERIQQIRDLDGQ